MPFTKDDISIMDSMAREMLRDLWNPRGDEYLDRQKISRTHPPIKEQKMNVQEKSFVKSFMEITHGPGASLDQLITAAGYFHAVEAQIMVMGLPIPKDLREAITAVDRDLKIKMETENEKKLRDLESKRETLLSNEEKLKAVEEQIKKLKEQMKK